LLIPGPEPPSRLETHAVFRSALFVGLTLAALAPAAHAVTTEGSIALHF